MMKKYIFVTLYDSNLVCLKMAMITRNAWTITVLCKEITLLLQKNNNHTRNIRLWHPVE